MLHIVYLRIIIHAYRTQVIFVTTQEMDLLGVTLKIIQKVVKLKMDLPAITLGKDYMWLMIALILAQLILMPLVLIAIQMTENLVCLTTDFHASYQPDTCVQQMMKSPYN